MVVSRWTSTNSPNHRLSSRSPRAVRIEIDAQDDLFDFEPKFDICAILETVRVFSRCLKEGMAVSVTGTYNDDNAKNKFWCWNLAQEPDIGA